jgi:rfaE bifunctional protein kinase chain/domain/rfaE bifunctional protein nucleotidyltransferase chain/domain
VAEAAEKIRDLSELATDLMRLRAQGKRIVHAHGVYDLLHPGHMRHLESAKRMGDVLVVTLTEDRFVNKGPHRPAFPAELRAESVASLAAVDYVAISRSPLSLDAIRALRPDVYVKGADYRDPEKDQTGGIVKEMEAVRAVGGEVAFTDDIVFSSSTLLNRFLPPFSRDTARWLEEFRRHHRPEEIADQLETLRALRVLVIGEAIVDEYVSCEALGKSGKEPILAMRACSAEAYPGGALAIANHLAEIAGEVRLVTCTGPEPERAAFIRSQLRPEVAATLLEWAEAPTIVKRRYVDQYFGTKLLEIYRMKDAPLRPAEAAAFARAVAEQMDDAHVVIAADYGHGLISPALAEQLGTQTRFLAANTQLNAANVGFHTIWKYPCADFVCLHEGELRLAYRSRTDDPRRLAAELAQRLGTRRLMITRGSNGTLLYERSGEFVETPALATRVVDRVGAGDAVLALTSLCAVADVPADVTGFLANLAGADVVASVGNSRALERLRVLRSVESLLK